LEVNKTFSKLTKFLKKMEENLLELKRTAIKLWSNIKATLHAELSTLKWTQLRHLKTTSTIKGFIKEWALQRSLGQIWAIRRTKTLKQEALIKVECHGKVWRLQLLIEIEMNEVIQGGSQSFRPRRMFWEN